MKNIWLAHHGILGQKWGVRRFQKKDGSLTEAGKEHYGTKVDHTKQQTKEEKIKKIKKAVRIGATAAGVALAAYGAYKGSEYLKSEAGKLILEEGEKRTRLALKRASEYGWKADNENWHLNDTSKVIDSLKNGSPNNMNPQFLRKIEKLENIKGVHNADLKAYRKLEDYYYQEANHIKDATVDSLDKITKSTIRSAEYLLKKRKKH